MNFRKRIKDPRVMARIGWALLPIAILSLHYLHLYSAHPTANFPLALTDGAIGMTFGIAIGCLLLAARLNARRRDGRTPCA
jgi:hypothetical protein